MATEELRQRFKDEPISETTTINNDDNISTTKGGGGGGGRRQGRNATARRGLRSLAVAVAVPVALHLAVFFSTHRADSVKARVFLSPWMLHGICVAEAALMGLSSWLMWAAGGFHRKPYALGLYLGYVGLSLAWDPIVLGRGWVWAGLPVSLGMMGTLAGCLPTFREVNPIAGDMAKICLIWAAFVVCLNLKLAYW